jgi:hypothetical protein
VFEELRRQNRSFEDLTWWSRWWRHTCRHGVRREWTRCRRCAPTDSDCKHTVSETARSQDTPDAQLPASPPCPALRVNTMKGRPGISFVIMGVVFLGIGASGQRNFLGIGVAFLAIGIALLVRQKRAGGSK